MFSSDLYFRHVKHGLFGKGLTLYHTIPTFTTLKKKALENTVEKKMLVTSIFFFFQQCFLLCQREIIILAAFNLSSANAFNLISLKILSFGNGLTLSQTSPGLYVSAALGFWKHCGKRRNGLLPISPLISVFSTLLEKFLLYSSNLKLSSAISFSLEESKICCLGKD